MTKEEKEERKEEHPKELYVNKVELISLFAKKNDKFDKGGVVGNIELGVDLEEEKEEKGTIICSIKVSFEDKGPFEFDVKLRGYFRKHGDINWESAYKQDRSIIHSILSEASLVIANSCSAMRYPPLILSPNEMLKRSEKVEAPETKQV